MVKGRERALGALRLPSKAFLHASSIAGGLGQDDFEPPSFEISLPPGIPEGFQPLRLVGSETIANNTKLLSFELPKDIPNLVELHVPSGVK